ARAGRAASYRWQDDRTTRTYQHDAAGSEVVLRERGAASRWRFASQGPRGLSLGDSRQKIEAAFQTATTSGGATVYHAPSKSPYRLYMVWYANGKAERIVAVHRDEPGVKAEEVTAALRSAWERDLDELGTIRRKEGRHGDVLGSWFWHDDAARIQTFVQIAPKGGAQVLTEWRAWPIAKAT